MLRIGVQADFPVYITKGVENYSKKINLLRSEWVFFMPIPEACFLNAISIKLNT